MEITTFISKELKEYFSQRPGLFYSQNKTEKDRNEYGSGYLFQGLIKIPFLLRQIKKKTLAPS